MYEPRVFFVLDRESKRQLVTPEDDTDYIDDYSDANLLDDLYNFNNTLILVLSNNDNNINIFYPLTKQHLYNKILANTSILS